MFAPMVKREPHRRAGRSAARLRGESGPGRYPYRHRAALAHGDSALVCAEHDESELTKRKVGCAMPIQG